MLNGHPLSPCVEFAVCNFALCELVNLPTMKLELFLFFEPFMESDEMCKSVNALKFLSEQVN